MTSPSTIRITGRHYQTRRGVELEISGDRIARCDDVAPTADIESWPWIAPGLIDIQSNGYGGQEFSSPELTTEAVATIARQQASFGVTQFCPTVTTASFETIVHSVRTIAAACERWSDV